MKGNWLVLFLLGLLTAQVSDAAAQPYSLSIEIYAGLTTADRSMSRPFLQELTAFKEGSGPAPAELGRILHLTAQRFRGRPGMAKQAAKSQNTQPRQ